MEARFIDGWTRGTMGLRTMRGGLGSRLHRGPDDIWYAYAQWPSAAARDEAFAMESVDAEARAMMNEAVLEWLPEIPLEPVVDLLLPVDGEDR